MNSYIKANEYERSLDIITKKSKGIYYTPENIVRYIIDETLRNHDVIKNPYPKVIDISCGCGNFIVIAYDVLFELFEKNLGKIKLGNEYMKYEDIHYHIITECLYGIDIDKDALNILENILDKKFSKYKKCKYNLYCEDALKYDYKDKKYDYVIGNPPYIGHKEMSKDYKIYLKKYYKEVYKDKGDIYFCFYKKIIDILTEDGVCGVITPRYFIESISSINLKKYMNENISISKIIDFLGASVFQSVGICSCIVILKKQYNLGNDISVYRIKDQNTKIYDIQNLDEDLNRFNWDNFYVKQDIFCLNNMLLNESESFIFDRFNDKCVFKLDDIVCSFQGIITGCDKAFIINDKENISLEQNNNIIKKWIKNKNVKKYIIEDSSYNLIYSNDLKDEEDLIIKNKIKLYKDKLLNRRECKNNKIKWYHLQWGRDKSLFERKKIMYPYKSSENRFAIDEDFRYSSADVYSFYVKEEYEKDFSYEYLVGILNSKPYNQYYKMIAKKMSKDIYDYYPNKVLEIPIFKDDNYNEIDNISKNIIKSLNNNYSYEEINDLEKNIDMLICRSLNI